VLCGSFIFLPNTRTKQLRNLRMAKEVLFMTKEQKHQIAEMRKKGLGYIKIGQVLGVSDNTISSYCRRNGLDSDTASKAMPCKQCGKPIKRASGRKPKKFCSDACRMLWWNEHRDCVNRKAIYEFTCANCGHPFSAYGNKGRKYCSHVCYIADRYRKECVCDG